MINSRVQTPVHRGLVIAFFIATILSIIFAHYGLYVLGLLLKGLPVMLLLVLVRYEDRMLGQTHLSRWLWWGLAAGMIGDVAIEFNFIVGLVAFLVGHFFYLFAMGRPQGNPLANLLAALPAVGVWFVMVGLLVVGGVTPENMVTPIIIYLTVIILMMARAWGRGLVEPANLGAMAMLIGSALFVFSDAFIALDRWVSPIPYREILILSTYYVGQFLISRAR